MKDQPPYLRRNTDFEQPSLINSPARGLDSSSSEFATDEARASPSRSWTPPWPARPPMMKLTAAVTRKKTDPERPDFPNAIAGLSQNQIWDGSVGAKSGRCTPEPKARKTHLQVSVNREENRRTWSVKPNTKGYPSPDPTELPSAV